ncbi:hypothetical protein BDZ90DRAFT_250910 [Jaminaea rosea]|uniref:Cystathionine beta-lyase n=1 Tax=Jaminaea rosea TaxID=1569628 RepID=A0A316USZ6_9BASI|nr:hypothetical protein BDZ90DRAFT_250910 [Jaminaea rosea]PWN28419.1 hypothetical protein BDZ90DRAFT_250910 [Jaminaea rosea]
MAPLIPAGAGIGEDHPSKTWSFQTLCATIYDPDHLDQYGSSSTPIYQCTTFKGLPGTKKTAYDYSRSSNPSRSVLQNHLSKIQGAKYSFAVSTGMACLDIITRSVKPNEVILAGDDIYGGTHRLLGMLMKNNNIKVVHVDMSDQKLLAETVRQLVEDGKQPGAPKLGMVLVETPTNPMLKVIDIRACVQSVRKYISAEDAPIIMDNTMMSPALMRPLELGVDAVYDSATKYLSGHHDLMAGIIATNNDDLAQTYHFTINSVGNALAPFESFLLMRGLKTLHIRLAAQQLGAQRVAEHLQGLGFKTHYPGLKGHPGRDMHFSQAKGAGAVISFETDDPQLSQMVVNATRLWGVSVSFGSVNSLISMPCLMSHAAIDPKVRAARALPENLLRLCVGIEDPDDLIADLDAAFLAAGALHKDANGQLTRAKPASSTAANGSMSAPAAAAASPASQQSIVVSAPGKVILFGEHAVVHGVTALAASVGLRCYALVQPRGDGKVQLELPELKVNHEWIIADLPWDAVPSKVGGLNKATETPTELDARLLRRIVQTVESKAAAAERDHASCVAFLYLFMTLGAKSHQGQTFTFRSLLPISAGLGSSAAYSACLASALLYTNGVISIPSASSPISSADADLVNSYAFLSERVLHGNPSGVDNSVAVYGGCLTFTRPSAPRNQHKSNELKLLPNVHAKRLLLTDTGVSRDTKALVAGVQQRLDQDPSQVNAAFDTIQKIADEAAQLLTSGGKDADVKLGELMKKNHQLLASPLGVSHPSLEEVRNALSTVSPALSTKLTGAGGGGCAVTLIPSGTPDNVVSEARESLQRLPDFSSVHETVVGGSGLSVLGDVKVLRSASVDVNGETGEQTHHFEGERFAKAGLEELGEWLEGTEGKARQGWSRVEQK